MGVLWILSKELALDRQSVGSDMGGWNVVTCSDGIGALGEEGDDDHIHIVPVGRPKWARKARKNKYFSQIASPSTFISRLV